jgi:acyl-CoA dehydrogenase
MGFYYMMEKLQQERLVSAIMSQASAEAILRMTLDFLTQHKGFHDGHGEMSMTDSTIVEMATDVEVGRVFLNSLIRDHLGGEEVIKKVSMAKWWTAEMANRVASLCMELYRDYGYLEDYKVARFFRDVRAHPIYAGTNEIMKRIIAKVLGL